MLLGQVKFLNSKPLWLKPGHLDLQSTRNHGLYPNTKDLKNATMLGTMEVQAGP